MDPEQDVATGIDATILLFHVVVVAKVECPKPGNVPSAGPQTGNLHQPLGQIPWSR